MLFKDRTVSGLELTRNFRAFWSDLNPLYLCHTHFIHRAIVEPRGICTGVPCHLLCHFKAPSSLAVVGDSRGSKGVTSKSLTETGFPTSSAHHFVDLIAGHPV